MQNIHWGVIGCGNIAHQFARGIKKLDNCSIVAGASLTTGRAESFAKTHQIQSSYTNYQSLVNDPNVHAVYIATTHNFHFENIKLCLEKGKHVLCEKPFTINAEQSKTLAVLAKQNNCFMMECVWTRFLPTIQHLSQLLAQNVIGDVHTVKANFSICSKVDPGHRLRNKALAGGALLDLGIYPLTLASIVFGDTPSKIQSSAVMNEDGIDESSCYLLEYEHGQRAILSSSITEYAPNDGIISGSNGYIVIPNFLGAQELHVHINDQPSQILSFPFDEDDNFVFETSHAMECIRQNKCESDILPLNKTTAMMTLMDTLRKQWGLKYPGE
ncbi:Gfo/Idh/MocA family oxidoreductase [Pseudocolwellia sp. AS88]|uniref:Gfo/Idh/MocA family protein n=1 Tax=Pseudocolwellia sp. AS88 TaxID=3063958 RepID=UPI0026F33F03|nr:Gfo/Idh/MocA family oxidoreductase [Pseudocolwellia sp. AS88]MDO7084786.1 Gfo/Idh/MocA family oxidoreductase [Pseudocolwellia sp. AS88]